MAQLAMVSAQVEIKSSASTFFGFLKEKLPQLPHLQPDSFKNFRFLEGNEIRDGAVISFQYELGSTMTVMAKAEVNESSKTARFVVMDGDVLKHYSAFVMKYQIQSSGHVKITVEFEKARESSPNPDAYVSFASKMIKRLDIYLSRT